LRCLHLALGLTLRPLLPARLPRPPAGGAIDVQKSRGPLARHEARVFSTAQHELFWARAQLGPTSVPGSTAISARWASPSMARYLVGFETGPLQIPTPSGPATKQARGHIPAAQPPAPPAWINRRRGRRHLASPITLTLVSKSYRAAHPLNRSSPL
jgi:hypothetical protein